MDPAAERLVPARAHLANSYLYHRALTSPSQDQARSLPDTAAENILEYLGIVPSIQERRSTRNAMLKSQLLPKHRLGGSETMVCGTGLVV